MLVVVGFFILTFTGGVLSGRKTPPPCDIDEPLCPKNQHYTQNDTTCLKTCANRLVVGKCCKPFTGCVCNDGLVRLYDDATGPCIPEKSCRKKCKDKNAVFKKCPSPCPLTCAEPNPRPCPLYCPKSGCECASGFVLSKTGGKCIKLKDCPVPRCPKNEHYVREDKDCVKTCGNRLLPGVDTAGACAPYTGCVCDTDHVRKYDNGTGPCIPVRSCPRIPKKCGQNEQRTSCRIKCPPQTCESIFTTYDCPEPTCEPGCDCINGYLRDAKGICIPSDKCSKSPTECGPNEVLSDCKIVCPPQSCESLYTTYLCAKGNCTPGCNCIDGYLRNSVGVCIPSEECSKEPCKGDSNATQVPCASKCPLTCAQPDSSRPCPLICVLNACECKPGYIFSKPGGVCIAPSDCPDGSPQCGANRTYVDCYVGCQSEYCPADDSRAIVACSVAYPCPGGCACNPGYLIESRDNPRCILSEECPPVNCTRPNEIWHPNPSNCLLESCEDRGRECDNKKPGPPRCVCQKGYYRNRSDVCVPASECPDLGCNGDLNATFSNCTSDCPARCADLSEEGGGRVCAAVCRPPGCACKKDYVLNDLGKCIKPEDCTVGCKGDLNATEVKCGTKCPATCAEPEDIKSCVRICVPNACKCNPGYILSKLKGVCIAPNDCPDGSPKCGANQTYVRCKIGCPTNYCPSDDSRAMVACSMPYPCPGGCACNPGYLLESRDNPRCILSEECPPVKCTRPNEVWDRKPPNCFLERCEDRGRKCDNKYPAPPRCVCQKGYYRNANDICVPSSECPDLGCNGDLNATYSNCTSGCPARCADMSVEGGGRLCAAVCRPPGCVCKKDYVLNDLGKCIKPEDCPEVGCNGDPNAVRDDCASACQPTCSKPTPAELCIAMCSENPCVCKTGYILDKKDGKCIERKSCPVEPQCKEDRNETYSTCPSHCQATCDEPDTTTPCVDSCKPPGCICKQGYLKTKHGKCISPKDCPGGSPTCGVNQTYVDCKIGCPNNNCPVDDRLAVVVCDPPFPCPGGCVCKEGYLRNNYEKERCILSSECPPVECTRPNEVWESNPPKCLREKCTDIDSDTGCNFYYPNSPRCICKKGYYRNESDICVPASKCTKPKCGYNEVEVPCRQICPPQNCEIAYTDYACGDETKICEPGCNCLPDYFRNGSGICIPNDKCPYPSTPVCGVNEIARDCRRICPPQTCISKYALFRCKEDIPCEPGCDCISNYLRDINGICIPSDKCPPLCSVPDECKRTCMTPNPPNCDYRDPPKSNIDGCECKQGYILSKEDGVCIKIEECPNDLGCNGDPHARTTLCPHPCPSTCEAPNATPCKRMCDPIGCACEDNYILSNITGKCILPDKCPGGNPCGKTGRFVSCKVNCPNDYCPVDDSRDIVLCDPPKNCLSGCICNLNHKRKSYKDPQCIVSSDCPPVCCTRPDEVWDSCPSACLAENCEDVNNQPSTCNTLVLNCEPRCICKKNYFRNGTGICIPAKKCQPPTPVCGENEIARDCRRICPPQTCLSKYALFKCKADIPCEPGCDCIPDYLRNENGVCIPSEKCPPLCSVPDECKRTCMTPNPPNCDYRDPPKSNIDGCECKQGYILSKKDGVCIKIEECPNDLGCNGDPHARTTLCPHPCPSTCDAPNATPCKRMCDPIGCACEDNYMLSNITGKCILPDKCPGGNPCGKTGRFVSCKVDCPNDYCPVDDSRDIVLCDPPKNCLSGCICNLNHKRKSYKDPQCIVSSDCPPVCCTRPDEVWDSCPSACLAENCEDVNNQPTTCNTLVLNCEPRCICKKDYFRNASGICIPAKKCQPPTPVCGENEIARDCRRICPPQTCLSKYALFKCKEDIPCEPGCDCIPDYLRNENGVCIPSEKCPPLCSVPDECKRTCMTPNPPNCDYRDPPKSNIDGCECKQGYILSKKDGVCIKIEECPNDLGCNGDPHARTTLCPHPCPSTCDAPNATPCKRMCDPIGCACEDNYMLSNITGKCILPDKCPGGNPCGKTGRFVSCKVDCPNDYCPVDDSRDIVLCDPPKNCLSGCICNLNHKRKSYKDPQCIVSSDCPPVCCTRPDEVWDSCPSACLAENCEDVNNQPTTCNTLVLNCEPRCICKKDYFRNASGICIPAKKCQPPTPVCGENEIARDCRRICPPQTCLSKYALFKCKEDIPCEPGCDCIPDYLRNENGVCIPSEKCPPLCSVPDECKRTCMTPNPPNCDYRDPPKSNIDGCECKQGYILSKKDGVCIKIEECPNDLGCNGDPHARTTLCPHPCPSTCDAPNATPCKRMCDPIGCACEDNYMLSNITGKCILPDKCPGGNPCGKTGRFVSCKVNCPNDYCPVDDSRDIVLCDPPKNCLSGCICKLNHKRKSYKDPRCIVSSDCPPVCCTRPDEVWDSCPSPCLAENCEDVNNQPTACNTLIAPTCEPRCICKKNYFRNATGICIPAKKCPC